LAALGNNFLITAFWEPAMFKSITSILVGLMVAIAPMAVSAHERDHRGGYGRHEYRGYYGRGDGLGLALGLGLGAVVLSEALRPEPVYIAPRPVYVSQPAYIATPALVAVPGSSVYYPDFIAYEAQDGYGNVHACRQYHNGYRTCS
jgi:hypothetical protein